MDKRQRESKKRRYCKNKRQKTKETEKPYPEGIIDLSEEIPIPKKRTKKESPADQWKEQK